jgi:hypothetical protein
MLEGAPIWHGLRTGYAVLGAEVGTEEARQLERIVADYGAGLKNLARALEAQNRREGTHARNALKVWEGCQQ